MPCLVSLTGEVNDFRSLSWATWATRTIPETRKSSQSTPFLNPGHVPRFGPRPTRSGSERNWTKPSPQVFWLTSRKFLPDLYLLRAQNHDGPQVVPFGSVATVWFLVFKRNNKAAEHKDRDKPTGSHQRLIEPLVRRPKLIACFRALTT
jgi:hypothetical protein